MPALVAGSGCYISIKNNYVMGFYEVNSRIEKVLSNVPAVFLSRYQGNNVSLETRSSGMSQAAVMSEANRIARFIGLKDWREVDDLELVHRIEAGLPLHSVRQLVLQIDPDELRIRVHDLIPKATYCRLSKSKQKALSKDQSDKIFALPKVFSESLRLYNDDRESTATFLTRRHPLLGDRSPLDVARASTAGADLVLKLLDKAEAGIAV